MAEMKIDRLAGPYKFSFGIAGTLQNLNLGRFRKEMSCKCSHSSICLDLDHTNTDIKLSSSLFLQERERVTNKKRAAVWSSPSEQQEIRALEEDIFGFIFLLWETYCSEPSRNADGEANNLATFEASYICDGRILTNRKESFSSTNAQSEKIRRLEGKNDIGEESTNLLLKKDDVDDLVNELVKTKHNNNSLLLDQDVLLAKMKVQDEEILKLKANKMDQGAQSNLEVCEDYYMDFPRLQGGDSTSVEKKNKVRDDSVEWVLDKCKVFSVSSAWNVLRESKPNVSCHDIVAVLKTLLPPYVQVLTVDNASKIKPKRLTALSPPCARPQEDGLN
ncbi:hypothetical protein LguiA_003272 [Lonicera macranthoides]